jgi:TRAP-type transport system periplasmic protein
LKTSGRSSGPSARVIASAAALGITLLAAYVWTSAAAAATWELLSPFPPDSYEVRNLKEFASDVAQATAGGLRIAVLADPARLDGRQIKQAVAAGRAPAGEFLLSDLRDEDAAFEVDSVPFLATDYFEALRLWDASRPVLEPMLEAQGLHTVFVVASPPRGMFASKKIVKMDDLRGLRILDDGPLTKRLTILADANPTLAPGSLAEAFAAGEIDAAIASLPAGAAEQVWKVVANYYDLRVTLRKSIVVFNKAAYRSLDPEIQRAVLNAAIAAQNRGWQSSATANNETMELLQAHGMTIAAPDPQLLADMREIGVRMTDEWARRAAPDGQTILRAYQLQRAGTK